MGGRAVNAFRRRRGRVLAGRVKALAAALGRPVRILDVGGRRDYWENVGYDGVAGIELLNIDPGHFGRATSRDDLFTDSVGDARDLSRFGAGAFDFYHSNSVIEHVGGWDDMRAMAREAMRVAPRGWVQTPAWEFPIEPHFRLPVMHWFAAPTRARLLRFARSYRSADDHQRRWHAERINLLSRREVGLLFPEGRIETERVVLVKSYIVTW